MFKWVVGLCAAMYVTLLVFGEPPENESTVAVATESQAAEPVEAEIVTRAPAEQTEPVTFEETVTTAALKSATDKLVIESLEPAKIETPAVNVAATPEPKPVAEPAASAEPAAAADAELDDALAALKARGIGEIWRVTGSSVNLRAEATTQSAILGRTQRGDSAEVIELLENGWARVFVLENGQEAFMSAKFLKRETQ